MPSPQAPVINTGQVCLISIIRRSTGTLVLREAVYVKLRYSSALIWILWQLGILLLLTYGNGNKCYIAIMPVGLQLNSQ